MSTRIVLCYPVEAQHIEQIAAAMPGGRGRRRRPRNESPRNCFEADIFCGHAKVPVDWDGVVRQGRLRWIQSSAAGMDHCLVPSVIDSDIVVTSASGVLADQVAEHTIALVTGWCRSLPTFFRAQQKKEFIRRPTRDLTRSTVGIVGLGGVGRRLARLLAAFDARILATDMFPVDKPEHVEALWPADRLDDLLAAVDILVLCLPLNDSTRGMIDAAKLAKMKPGGTAGQHGPRTVGGHRRSGGGARERASGRRRDGRDRSRAAAARESAVGFAQRHHHAARRRPEPLADRQHDPAVLPQSAALAGGAAADQLSVATSGLGFPFAAADIRCGASRASRSARSLLEKVTIRALGAMPTASVGMAPERIQRTATSVPHCRENLVDRPRRAATLDVDHQVVEVRIGDVAVEELLDKFAAAFVDFHHLPPSIALADPGLFHDVPEPILRRSNDADGEHLLPRQEKLGGARRQTRLARAGGRQHHAAKTRHVSSRAAPACGPSTCPTRRRPSWCGVSSTRSSMMRGRWKRSAMQIQEVFVEDLPAQPLADASADLASAGAGLARDRHELHGPPRGSNFAICRGPPDPSVLCPWPRRAFAARRRQGCRALHGSVLSWPALQKKEEKGEGAKTTR